jgi:glycine/D-amino acid oxidase-like deaminating enzyme/nitrite reductase/ring-hydroxylating ferredoxin subunit
MESLWRKESGCIEAMHIESFMDNQELSVREWDVIVVGAGMTGLLTAYFLSERGKKVLVLEAKTVASGQSERTTAKITSQHGLKYTKLIKDIGMDKATLYAKANEEAIREYQRIITTNKIECDFMKTTAYLYSNENTDELIEEEKNAKLLGIDAFYTTATELPFEIKGAVGFKNQAQFQPLEFIKYLAGKLLIVEGAKVVNIKGQKVCVQRVRGEEEQHKLWHHRDRVDIVLKANKVVVATHYPLLKFKGLYFMRQHQERSYVVSLDGCDNIKGMYYGIDDDGLSFRQAGEYLLLGGSSHRTGENKSGGAYDKLISCAKKIYPECKEVARWSAQDCMPHDGIPFIGRYSILTPHLYVATGFQKWGMTSSMIAAMMIRDDIMGIASPYKKLFKPQRIHFKAGMKNFLTDVCVSLKGLFEGTFHRPKEISDTLPNGQGGMVTERGRTYACYKENNGRLHMISHRCTHLGCKVEWNEDEKSWDCPCHGSRYDINGKVLDNPANRDITHNF